MRKCASVRDYKIEVKGKVIVIYLADQDSDALDRIFQEHASSLVEKARIMTVLRQQLHYSPMMQFILMDEQRRRFWPQRYCFRGSIDDWIGIGLPDTLLRSCSPFVDERSLDWSAELVAIHKETNYCVVHEDRLGETNGFARQALDPRP